MSIWPAELAGVVLAAGRGSRLRPLTDRVPKPLLTIAGRPLLELAMQRITPLAGSMAVNAHHLADQIVDAARRIRSDVHISRENTLLGTAGALHQLRSWIDGRPVIVANSDMWIRDPLPPLLEDWDGTRTRLLVSDVGRPADFGTLRFLGVSLLPAQVAGSLAGTPSGLYRAVWSDAFARGELEFVRITTPAFDCGTPVEYITANLHAARARVWIAPDALVQGTVDLSVILSGARVGPDERLTGVVRDRFGAAVSCRPDDIEGPDLGHDERIP